MANWKDVVRGVAPALGTALLGPQAGAAISALSEKFLGKKDGTETELETRLTAGWTPTDELKLKELEQAFTLSLLDKVTAAETIDAGDRASARERQKSLKDWTPQVLAVATFGAFFTLLFLMAAHTVPTSNQQAMNLLLGVLAGAVTQVLNYYFGSSSGSASAREVIIGIAKKK